MKISLKHILFYSLTVLFLLLNVFLVYKGSYLGILLPLALVLVYVYFFNFDLIIYLIALSTPLSLNMLNDNLGSNLSLPSELLLLGALIMMIFHLILEKNNNKLFYNHRVSKAIFFYLFWMLVTSIFSTIPLVSFKHLISTLWFIVPMFFVGLFLFDKYSNSRKFIWAYTITLLVVVFYTLSIHGSHGFSKEVGHWAMSPFYNDHTAYGAILALFIPVVGVFIFDKKLSKIERIIALAVTTILMIALYFSYSRAAWLSLIISIVILILIIFKVKFRWILVLFIAFFAFFYTFQFQILDRMEKNKQDSSDNFIEHVRSISNISSDASNLERINRWQSAFRMFDEKPIFGFGPGTYQFNYAPFQLSQEKTIISTNFGNMGNTHSEYFGPLAEQGILGLVAFVMIAIMSLITGFNVYKRSKNSSHKLLALGLTLGLITYFVHGFLNNFLDTDKLSVPFWAFISMLVAMEISLNTEKQKSTLQSENKE